MGQRAIDRLLDLLRRQFAGVEVRLVDATAAPAPDATTVIRSLPGGRAVVITAPVGGAVDESRLDALLDAFAMTLERDPSRPASRRPIGLALQAELRALASRARAVDALIIDVGSPVLWCSAVTGPVPEGHCGGSSPRLLRAIEILSLELHELALAIEDELARPDREVRPSANAPDGDAPSRALPEESRRAIAALRERPDLDARRHGGRQRIVLESSDLGVLARGFADIYLLVLVYGGPFDELRAERTTTQALPRIERLVVALPPLDPEPEGPGRVVSLRKR